MRKRNHVIPLHLNVKEMKHLDTQVGVSGLSREEFLRTLIMGAEQAANHSGACGVAYVCSTTYVTHTSSTRQKIYLCKSRNPKPPKEIDGLGFLFLL